MSHPPEDNPPGERGPKLFDAQAERVTEPPPEFPSGEPPTKNEGRRTTLSPEDADREMVRQALLRVATYGDTLERIEKRIEKLDSLVVKTDALDHGIGVLIRADERLERKLDQLRSDLQLWLFGDTHRHGIAQEVGLARVRIDSLFPMVEKLARGAPTTEGAANGNGNGHHEQDSDTDRTGSDPP